MKKILILTSERTGTGHKSSANALEKQLKDLNYEVKQVDCFSTMKKTGELLENSYIPITTKFPLIFYIAFLFSQVFPDFISYLMYIKSRKMLKKEILNYNPDLIISNHPMFTKAISHLLKKEKLNIPFFIDVIDLVNPTKIWLDKNADIIFVPTDLIKSNYVKKGVESNKLIVSGFPIRNDIEKRTSPKTIKDYINILLVNPSVSLKKNILFVKEVSKIKNTNINIICGRDVKLYNKLIKEQVSGKISQNVKVHSFVNNMNEFLENAHILLTKAGPNMILEGARSGTAIVITGFIKGQENDNYKYVVDNNFGFKCDDPKKIYMQLNDFIKNHKLDECLKNVISADCNDGTKIITDYITDFFQKEKSTKKESLHYK